MSKIDVGGIGLNVRQMGRGPDVVLVHGLATNQAFWHPTALRTFADHFRVTVFDQRGHGYSDVPDSGYAVAEMAGDLNRLMDAMGIAHAHIVGHSYGGAVALQHAFDHPDRVLSLTVADARITSLQPTLRPADFPQSHRWMEYFREAGLDVGDETVLDFSIFEVFADARWRDLGPRIFGDGFFVPFGGWNGAQRSAKRWRDLLERTTARRDFCGLQGPSPSTLRQLGMPVLAYYGEHSHCLPSGRALAEFTANGRLVVHPKVGHFFPCVRPAEFARETTGFIADTERERHASPSPSHGATQILLVEREPRPIAADR